MIYLDNHATTPCDPLVVDAMVPYFSTLFGNSSSIHEFGQLAAETLTKSQIQIAELFGGEAQEITFTSGATESNNLAILGIAKRHIQKGGTRRKLITTRIEHKAVLSPIQHLQEEGWEVEYLPIDKFGQVDLHLAEKIISDSALLISVQLANSEIGTIQPISKLSEIAHRHGVMVHCDAAQAFGKTQIAVQEMGMDFMSISAHKVYGPKGIGALWIREGFASAIAPLMYGGGQGKGIRPGTQVIPSIVGFGKACEIIIGNFNAENRRVTELRDHFEQILIESIPRLKINGAKLNRLNNNSSVTFPDVDAEALLLNMPNIVASTNSACESGSLEPSRVLVAIGLTDEGAFQTIRFGFGRFNTEEQIEIATTEIIESHKRLTELL